MHSMHIVPYRTRVCTRRDGKPDVHFCRDIAVFDTAAESWVRTIDMPPDMEGRAYHTASLVDGSKIWVVCAQAWLRNHAFEWDCIAHRLMQHLLTCRLVAVWCITCLVTSGFTTSKTTAGNKLCLGKLR